MNNIVLLNYPLHKRKNMADVTRLPGPNSDLWDWQLKGACRGEDPEIFFHPEGERGPSRENRIALAKSICATCPVLRQCAEHALAVREPYGVWGAMSEDDREAIYAPVKESLPAAG
jgi:WhiB family redox-sensing transcriptional regulator